MPRKTFMPGILYCWKCREPLKTQALLTGISQKEGLLTSSLFADGSTANYCVNKKCFLFGVLTFARILKEADE
jgi:hypothetical protein